MFKKIFYVLCISFHFFTISKETSMNDHEPIHIFAALKFPLSSVKDTFTLQILKQIDKTFASKGVGLDAYQIEHIKKTYLYLIFLTKLEKVITQTKYKQYQKDFAPFLKDNGQEQPHMITTELLQSDGWDKVIIDETDIQNSTIWQYFCKSMVTDIYAYTKLALNILHNTEKQEFNYIPHFETSYYDEDFEKLRNINAVVRIKIELEQQIQHHYLAMCNDWKNLSIVNTPLPKNNSQQKNTVYSATRKFSLTDFYKKTHNAHTLMGTHQKIKKGEALDSNDLMSAPQLVSPLKDYVFCYFLLYELYGQLTTFMTESNLDQVISILSTSDLKPNIFPYTHEEYVLISELLATKSAAQKTHTNSINPPIKNYKKEDLRKYHDMLNPTRKPTDQYLQQKLQGQSSAQTSVQAQSFWSFFSHIGSDIVHAAKSAWSDIKHGAEDAWHAVKHVGEAVGYGVAGLALEGVGIFDPKIGQEGTHFFSKSQRDLKRSVTDLGKAVKNFGDSLKDGIVAPLAEVTGDVVGFVMDDKAVGQDFDTIIDNSAAVLVDFVADSVETAATALVYVASLPATVELDLAQLTIAAVYAAIGGITGNKEYLADASDICHSVLRSLVNVYLMTMKAAKDDFTTVMQALSVVMNAITTLFNDLIVEVTAIVLTGGASLVFNMIAAATGEDKYNYLAKAANVVRNGLNEHREIENQVLGVAVCIAVDVATGGEGAEADELILDAASEDAFNDSIDEAGQGVEKAQEELTEAQQKAEAAEKEAQQNPNDQEAQDKANEAKKDAREKEENLRQKKENLKQAKDTKTQAIKDAKDLKYGKNFKEKLIKKAQNFFSKCKGMLEKSATKSQDLFKSLATAIKGIGSASAEALPEASEEAANTITAVSEQAATTTQEITPLVQDAKEVLPPEVAQKLAGDSENLSQKIDDLSQARKDFETANTELKAAQNDSEQFAQAQKKLLEASKKVQTAASEVEKAQTVAEKTFTQALKYEKDLNENPLKYIQQNSDDAVTQAEQDLKTAQDNLATEEEIGDSESIQKAKEGVSEAEQKVADAKNLQSTMNSASKSAAKQAEEDSVTVGEKFSNKFKDMQEYLKSKGRSLKNLFKDNQFLAKQAEEQLETEQANLAKIQEQVAKDQKALDDARVAAKEDPTDPDKQADVDRAERQLKNSQREARASQRDVDRAQDYAKERETAAKESKWEKVKRIAGDTLSPIGTIMNIIFNFTPIISSYNQDQKNILQQKQQAEQMQDLWKANTETKISTVYKSLKYLEEFYEKQKAAIGNQILGLSLFQNNNYSSIGELEQSITTSLAMVYTLQLFPDQTTRLLAGNVGTLWDINAPYLNLYPSQGFYTTTIGRTDYPFAQEIAQAPSLLTQTSKTKTKEWFNQRCTGIDQTGENNVPKKPTDPLKVTIDFKFLYTLESEFYVGIYMGKNFYDYFNISYIAQLLGTTTAQLQKQYTLFINSPQTYPFNLHFININEAYMAKMVVLYRTSATDNLKLGIYEHNLSSQEWLFTQDLAPSMQLNHNHEYNLQATLNGNTLEVTLIVDEQAATKITQTVTVTPLDNQRQYGIISSSAAIEWKQITPKTSLQPVSAIRKPNNALTPEIIRNKQNKLLIQDAINQTFGGKKLTIISKQNALLFSQYIYASVQTDIAKILPKYPSDLLIFATNNNGTISELGKAPNSFKDSATNVLVSLITGHVFDSQWNYLQTVQNAWQQYSTPTYAPFAPTINQVITQQKNLILQKLSKISFGSFNLDAANPTLLSNGLYVYTSMQTMQDATGKPTLDYLVFMPTISNDPETMIMGLPPVAHNVACLVSLISGNVYTKETVIPKTGIPTPASTIPNATTLTNFILYVSQLGQLKTTIQTLQQAPPATQNLPVPVSTVTLAKKESLTKAAKSIPSKFHFPLRNFAQRQKQAAADVKFHFLRRPKR